MKIGIVCAFAFVALVNGLDENVSDLRVCKPGATKMEDCNRCFCMQSGAGWACTRMMCLRPNFLHSNVIDNQGNERIRIKRHLGDNFTCKPYESFMEDCNQCFCLPDGRSAGCTLMLCPPKDPSSIASKLNSAV